MSDWRVHLTCTEDGSSKFWRARADGAQLVVNYGKIGSEGQYNFKDFASESAALEELDKQAKSKRKKGYQDLETVAAPPPPPVVSAPEGPKRVALALDLEGQKMTVEVAVEGSAIRTTVLETYPHGEAALRAFQRIVEAMVADGYQSVK